MSALFDQDDLDQCLIFLESEAVVQNMLCQNCQWNQILCQSYFKLFSIVPLFNICVSFGDIYQSVPQINYFPLKLKFNLILSLV